MVLGNFDGMIVNTRKRGPCSKIFNDSSLVSERARKSGVRWMSFMALKALIVNNCNSFLVMAPRVSKNKTAFKT